MSTSLVLLGIGAAFGLCLAIAPKVLLGPARANLKAFMREPPDDAAILVLLRAAGAGIALVLGVVFTLMLAFGL